jgi:adenylosuccinate synthase
MSNVAVIGMQWGDEGKGKITHLLTPAFDIVARFQGGHNAGHTVYMQGRKVILHLIPSGVLHPNTSCLLGNGMVISPPAFQEEKQALENLGVEVGENIAISPGAHLIMPYHFVIERLREEQSDHRIGTTCRGIGPAYADKAARMGIKVGDLLNPGELRAKIEYNVAEKNILLRHYGEDPLVADRIFDEVSAFAELLGPYIHDVSFILERAVRQGRAILFEGAQGTLLDLDHGSYPYVTSSNSTAGGICSGLGIGPDKIDAVLGVAKAYTTRVGEGPFPTEATDQWGDYLRKQGQEYGATTGRPRRCGWLDAVQLAFACRVNGMKRILLTKSDVLDGLEEIRVCTAYSHNGRKLEAYPAESWVLERVTPRYRTLAGWRSPVAGKSEWGELPQEFKDYVKLIEDLLEVDVALISTGVGKDDTVIRPDAWKGLVDLGRLGRARH